MLKPNKKSLWFSLASSWIVFSLVWGSSFSNSVAVAAAGSTLNRPADPVVLTGANVPALVGIAPGDLVAFRYDNGWVQIPVQVDERANVDLGLVYNSTAAGLVVPVYTDVGTFTGPDPNTALDNDDEIAFMAKDAGGRAGSVAAPSGAASTTGVEVTLTDPLAPTQVGYVYLFRQDGSLNPGAGQQYVNYQFVLLSGDYKTTYKTANGPNPENTLVTTAYYKHHFADRWIDDELHLYAGDATGVDILDRHKNLFAPGDCIRSEDTFSSGEGAFVTNKVGPVRAIRSYLGANSGPYTQREHLYYERRQDLVNTLRVHEIQASLDFMDYSPAAAGMKYYDDFNTTGVMIDGNPDTVTKGQFQWELVSGAQGSLSMSFAAVTDISNYAYTLYYLDDKSPSNSTDRQCTGDKFAYGSSGPFIAQVIPCTDPTKGCTNNLKSTRFMYYDAPGLTTTDAMTRMNWARTVLSVTTQTWQGNGSSPTNTPAPPTATATLSQTPTRTNTPLPTNTSTAGPSPTPTPTLMNTNTPTNTVPPTPTRTATPSGSTVMHVDNILVTDLNGNPKSVFNRGETLYWRVKIVDQNNAPVSGAAVKTDLVRQDNSIWVSPTATTGADGWALFSKNTQQSNTPGLYTIRVNAVTKTGATYNPAADVVFSATFTLQ